MSTLEKSISKQYYDTAEEIRQMAQRTQSQEIQEELLGLAARYERLAQRAEQRGA